MKKGKSAEEKKFYFVEQAKFIMSIVKKGRIYRVSDIHDEVTAFCRKNGLERVTDSFCKTVIKLRGGKLQKPGGCRNVNGVKSKKKRPDSKLFMDCYDPDRAVSSTSSFARFG
jgi:hypothetical protein